ncbi:MAG: LysE family translocator [Nitratireductor sp.]|nr:LysE family translocator [Nitratireductor sp.]
MEAILAFTIASFLVELTPGPNMTYLAIVSASQGRRAGMNTVAGVALGLAVIGTAAALGVTAAIQSSDLLYEALRWAGVLFLLYLALDGWRRSAEPAPETSGTANGLTDFSRGLIANLLNPKAAVFYVTVLPAFLPHDAELADSLLLTAIYVAVATAIHTMIVIAAGSAAALLTHDRQRILFGRALALLLALVALWFAISTVR